MHNIELQSPHWKLVLQPNIGMQTVACHIQHQGQWLELMPDCTQENALLGASNYHLVPYSNRIRDGLFTFEQQAYQLSNTDKHAIHGALRTLPWRISTQDAQQVQCVFDSRTDDDINWPWPISASASYSLEGMSLRCQLSLTNHSDKNMPAGLGWHPYFCRTLGGAQPTITLPASGVYPDNNGDCLPTGAAVPIPPELDFTKGAPLPAEQRIDHCFSGFTGLANINWVDAGLSLQIQASEHCQHAILYNPEQPFFALEPVTNANDAFNLSQQGIDAGSVTLAPEQTLSVEMLLTLITDA